jgi:hypothetical protein
VNIFTVFLLAAVAVAEPDPYSGTVQTINPDPFWTDPSFEEFAAQRTRYRPFQVNPVFSTDNSPDMAVLLEEGLGSQIGMDLLQQWMDDIHAEEYEIQLIEMTYGTPEEVKSLLDSLHTLGLEGAVFVGDLPAAWAAVWDTQVEIGEQFPCDYFFMDLDGEWLDLWVGFPRDSVPGQDGFYDTFQGTLDPEIWVGRIRTDNLSAAGDPVQMIRDYLEKNHAWRTAGDPFPLRALCYVDDDWQASGEIYQQAMELLFENVDLFNRSEVTCADDYEQTRLPDTYTWISPFVHSGPNNHFWQPSAGTTNWSEIAAINPSARFYNLFACSNCRFTTANNMGSIYAVAADHGLAAVGSTTSGAMLRFTYFYGPLGGGGSLGEAYRLWWEQIAQGGFSQMELNWHIGMVLLGDPSLVPVRFSTGVEEPEGNHSPGLILSPNPTRGFIQADVRDSPSAPGVLQVFDIAGRLIEARNLIGDESGRSSTRFHGLRPGLYFMRLLTDQKTLVERFAVIE